MTQLQSEKNKLKNVFLTFFIAMGFAWLPMQVMSEDDRTVTDVERQNDQRIIWERIDIGGGPKSLNQRENERSAQDVEGGNLRDSWEFANDSAQFSDLRNRVAEHEIEITDLENRVENIETTASDIGGDSGPTPDEGTWVVGDPEPEPFVLVDQQPPGDWLPPISTQERDFEQTRTTNQTFARTVNVYETNSVTGERRLAETYTESEARSIEETRAIEVTNNPRFGSVEGWSDWLIPVNGVICNDDKHLQPPRHEGTATFVMEQQRLCSEPQVSYIFYKTDGSVIEYRSRDRIVEYDQKGLFTTGTAPVECRRENYETRQVAFYPERGVSSFRTDNRARYIYYPPDSDDPNPKTFYVFEWDGVEFNKQTINAEVDYDQWRTSEEFVKDGFVYYPGDAERTDDNNIGFFATHEICRRPL